MNISKTHIIVPKTHINVLSPPARFFKCMVLLIRRCGCQGLLSRGSMILMQCMAPRRRAVAAAALERSCRQEIKPTTIPGPWWARGPRLGALGKMIQFQQNCNRGFKLSALVCSSRFHQNCNHYYKQYPKMEKTAGQRPVAPLIFYKTCTIGSNFSGILTGSPSRLIWTF